ncbi:hypothetical protein A2U01_0082471, partial [Trifolium medium]|nr:hypothetical protein [Trifolium medium]
MKLKNTNGKLSMLLLLNHHPQFKKDLIKIRKLPMNRLNSKILHF